MLPEFVQADGLSRRLSMKPGEVGNELRFFDVEVERDAQAFSPWRMQRQAQFFEHGDGDGKWWLRFICINSWLFHRQFEVFGT
jgi:hypothetical protein